MKAFLKWLVAVFRAWWGWLPSSAVAALLSYGQNIWGWRISPKYYITLLGMGLFYSSYHAWRKEWVENRTGPDVVLVSWNTRYQGWRKHEELQTWGVNDFITLRNVGTKSALNIKIGDFSWKELEWGDRIYIQALHPSEETQLQASFLEIEESNQHNTGYFPQRNIGYLRHVLDSDSKRYKGREPLSVTLYFSDANKTHFQRRFNLTLRRGPDDVNVEFGELEVRR